MPNPSDSQRPEHPWDAEQGLLEKVGARVRFVRQRSGKTATQLAALSGLPRSHISDIERGKRNPTLQTMDRIAQGIGCTLRDLMPPAAAPPPR
jgi:transcriptional regulator with XRE-family HTH domain